MNDGPQQLYRGFSMRKHPPIPAVPPGLLLLSALIFITVVCSNGCDSDETTSTDAEGDAAEELVPLPDSSLNETVDADDVGDGFDPVNCDNVPDVRPEVVDEASQIPYWRCCAEGEYGGYYASGLGAFNAQTERNGDGTCQIQYDWVYELGISPIVECPSATIPLPYPPAFEVDDSQGVPFPELGPIEGCAAVRSRYGLNRRESRCASVEELELDEIVTVALLEDPIVYHEVSVVPDLSANMELAIDLISCCEPSEIRFETAADPDIGYTHKLQPEGDRCLYTVTYFNGGDESAKIVTCDFDRSTTAAPAQHIFGTTFDELAKFEQLEECQVVED